MFGRNRRQQGYENIEDDEITPTSSLFDFLRPAPTMSISEMEPLMHVEAGTRQYACLSDAPSEYDFNSGEISIHRQSSRSENRWEHVENPDQFFIRFYKYHQGGGFMSVFMEHTLYLVQYSFVIFFATVLFQCVDYDVLFNNKNVTADNLPIMGKRRLQDAVVSSCSSHLHPIVIASLFCATVFGILFLLRTVYHLTQFYEIRMFYDRALGIDDKKLINLTWSEVLSLLCQKLPRLHVIISKDKVDELDIYQRILRFKNYFIAFINKEVLPPVLNVPFLGPQPYLSKGLILNLEFLFFWGPFSPWEGPYTLKGEYKCQQNIDRLTVEFQRSISILGFFNLLFMPLIFAYQVLYIFFSYVEMVKRDPSAFGIRRYSNYGRNKLRHFNELDHELQIRLSRSHKVATQYMNLFVSPLLEVVAKNIKFLAGSIFAVCFALSAWDEDVLAVEHMLTLMTVAFVVVLICNACVREQHIYLPEKLMNQIISLIHYAPHTWQGKAHTQTVRKEFEYLFPLTAQFIVEELLSPLLTPFILLFWIRPRARSFVEFFNRYTVSIEGLGDVCSFSQMDVHLHGDAELMNGVADLAVSGTKALDVANDSKTELSLLHFAALNPGWKPPAASADFINNFKARVEHDMAAIDTMNFDNNVLLDSINSIMDYPVVSTLNASITLPPTLNSSGYRPVAVNHLDGLPSQSSVLSSLHRNGVIRACSQITGSDQTLSGPAEEMAVNTLYLRKIVENNEDQRGTLSQASEVSTSRVFAHSSCIWGIPAQEATVTRSTLRTLFEQGFEVSER